MYASHAASCSIFGLSRIAHHKKVQICWQKLNTQWKVFYIYGQEVYIRICTSVLLTVPEITKNRCILKVISFMLHYALLVIL